MPTVKGAGRRRYAASHAKHDQRRPLTDRDLQAAHDRAEVLAAPMAPASTKAARFADAAEEAGWEVHRIRNEDRSRTVRAIRSDELILISWDELDRFVDDATYSRGQKTGKIRNAADGYRRLQKSVVTTSGPRRRLPFDPASSSDEEILAAVKGRKLTWSNSQTESLERGTVGAPVTVSLARGRRVLKFCCRETGYRACFIDAIVRVK